MMNNDELEFLEFIQKLKSSQIDPIKERIFKKIETEIKRNIEINKLLK